MGGIGLMRARLTFEHLPEAVATPLRQFYRRKRLKQLGRVVLLTALIHGALVLVGAHADRLFFLSEAARVKMVWVAHAATAAAALAGLVWFWARRPTLRQIVYELEGRLPADVEERYVTLENVLASGGLADRPVAQHLLARLQESVIEHARTLTPGRLVRDRVLRRLARVSAGVAVVVGLLLVPSGYQFPLMIARFYQPTKPLPKPSFLQVAVSPAGAVVGRGGEVVVQAQITGRIPFGLQWLLPSADQCVLTMSDGEVVAMSRVQRDLFLFSRSELETNFAFTVRCGDAETLPHTVRVVAQPQIIEASLTVTPPAYVAQPAVTITELDRPVALLPGSTVRLTFRTDQPVVTRTIQSAKPIEPAWDESTRTGTYDFIVKEKLAWEVTVTNAEGFANRERLQVVITLREDAAPVVQLVSPTGEIETVPGELVPVTAEVRDDFGVSEVLLRYVVNPDPAAEHTPQEWPVSLPDTNGLTAVVETALDLDKTGAVPGDVVALQLRARDRAGNDGFSAEVLVRVVPFTRDENERIRLAHLRFLAAALVPENAERLPALAGPAGVALDTPPSLLTMLEREHHFTDAPQHKADVRQLYGVLLKGAPPAALSDVVRGLTGYRQAKNLLWRLYGMRAEADRFHEQLGREIVNDRRAKLYLDSLQNIGSELIELGRGTKTLAQAEVERVVGELNTAAFQLRRGSVARRQASCDEVRRLIGELLALSQPALPVLAQQEAQARSQLAALPRAATADERLRGREPFLPAQWALAAEWADAALAQVADDERALHRQLTAAGAPPVASASAVASRSAVAEVAEFLERLGGEPVAVESLRELVGRVERRAADATEDFVLVKVREAVGRYRARTADLAAGETAVQEQALREALRGVVTTVTEGGPALAEAQAKYPVLEEFRRTRRAVETLAALRAGQSAAATGFLTEFPEAGLSYLASQAGLVGAAEQALQEGAVARAVESVRQLAGAVRRSGAGDWQSQLAGACAQIERDLLALDVATTEAGAATRRLVALGEVRKQLQALARELTSAGARARVTALEWRGGPDGIWEPPHRADAERSRTRLQQQVEFAQQQVMGAIAEGLRETPDARVWERGYQWAQWWQRVVRSELADAGGVRVGSGSAGKEGDPRLRFLREELEKARQVRGLKHYADPTKEYLGAVGDFLRY